MTDKDDITAIAAQGGNLNALLHCVLDDVRKTRAMIRVAIVDDHPIVRDGIVALFADGEIDVVGAVGTAADALPLVERTHPDVAVVDLDLPDASGEELIVSLRRLDRAPYVVVFSAYAGEERVERVFSAGATSYVRKGTPSDELLAVVRAAARGEAPLPPDIAVQLVNVMCAPRASRLTARERDILRLVASGRTDGRTRRSRQRSTSPSAR
jgi:DNA-binding NarL/FixJ family response regulator